MYEMGKGVPADYETAGKWYRLSAEQGYGFAQNELPQIQKKIAKQNQFREVQARAKQGDADAQFNVGKMCRKGRGTPWDYKAAVKWWSLAAEQGDAKSQYNLGLMYQQGKGVPKDYKEAVKW